MSSENLHAPRERLARSTLLLHNAITSLMEELEAVDWYRQRADDTDDEALKGILLHNMREEMEHATMVLEWIRRHSGDFDGFMRTYLFTEEPILEIEKADEAAGASGGSSAAKRARKQGRDDSGFTVGRLRGE